MVIMLSVIIKKPDKELVVSSWKNREYVSSSSLLCILISMSILSSLIEIDARRKFIYIDLLHIKFLRMFSNYRSLAYL